MSTRIDVSAMESVSDLLRGLGAAAAVDPGEVADLVMERPIHWRSPGLYPLAMQLIVTWGRLEGVSRLILSDPAPPLEEIDDHLLVAVLMADRVVDASEHDVHAQALEWAQTGLQQRRYLRTTESDTSVILADHRIDDAQTPDLQVDVLRSGEWDVPEEARTLYHWIWPDRSEPQTLRRARPEFDEVRIEQPGLDPHIARTRWPEGHPAAETEVGFRAIGERLLPDSSRVLTQKRVARVQAKRIEDEIGESIFELVQNTQQYALSDSDSRRLPKSCRVVHIQRQQVDDRSITDLASGDPDLAIYLKSVLDQTPSRTAELAWVSIVDSGDGLAKVRARRSGYFSPLTDVDELLYLQRALDKSIRVGRFDRHSGIGLARVQQVMSNLSGYVSISSGTHRLRRDYRLREFSPIDPTRPGPPKPDLFVEWTPTAMFKIPRVKGTAVTLIIPLQANGGSNA